MKVYDEKIDRVETHIKEHLRDRLATAKNANEMFRVFSKFNALFVRPKIKAAIQEYQAQLIEHVKEDIRKLHERFKNRYPNSQAALMSTLRDLPPISGAIIWARQIGTFVMGFLFNRFSSSLTSTVSFRTTTQNLYATCGRCTRKTLGGRCSGSTTEGRL